MDIRDNIVKALERIDFLTNQATTYERYKLNRAREILQSCMGNEPFWRYDRTASERARELVDFLGVYWKHQVGLDVCRFDSDGYLVPKEVDTETLLERLSDDTLEEANAIGGFLGVPQEREEPWDVVINTRVTASRWREFGSRQRQPGSMAEYDSADGDDEAEGSDQFSDLEEDEDAVYTNSTPAGSHLHHSQRLLEVEETWLSRASTSVQDVVRLLAGRLCSEYGYVVAPVSIPFHHHGQVAHTMTVLTDAANLFRNTRSISPANKILLALGRRIPATDFLFAQKLRQLLMLRLSHLWRSHSGWLITPTTGAPVRGDASQSRHGLLDANLMLDSVAYMWPVNFYGFPSVSVAAEVERVGRCRSPM
ncbi:hypothetical protein AUP68_13992 [Ilyonectria robusta]